MQWKSENRVSEMKNLSGEPDFNSKDGFQSAIFGPPFWMTIHLVSFNYPVQPTEEDKKNYSQWLHSMGKVLPCKYCRDNFEKNMKHAGFNASCLDSRFAFSTFCYDLHCSVNKMLGKESPSYEDIRSKYEIFRAKCLTNEQKAELQLNNKELGCIRPVHNGYRGKSVINIVPNTSDHVKSTCHIIVDEKCKPK